MSTSEPTAMRGGTPSRRTSAGVSSAPAPIDVMPTSSPTAAPTSAASGPKWRAAAGRATNGTAMAKRSSGLRGTRTQKSAGPGRGRFDLGCQEVVCLRHARTPGTRPGGDNRRTCGRREARLEVPSGVSFQCQASPPRPLRRAGEPARKPRPAREGPRRGPLFKQVRSTHYAHLPIRAGFPPGACRGRDGGGGDKTMSENVQTAGPSESPPAGMQQAMQAGQGITMRQLLEAGVHFGHQTKRWNPKMKPYIFGARNGIYIVDLQKTVRLAREAFKFVSDVCSRGGSVLFVGTKKQAQDAVIEEATRSG